MFSISLRQAKIGNQIQARGEMHGEDSVTAYSIPIVGVMIDDHELAALLQEPLARQALFVDRAGEMTQPLFPQLKPLQLKHKFEGGLVRIVHSIDNEEIKFTSCKIKSIKLEPQPGGLTEISFMVNTVLTLDARAARLQGQINHEVQIECSAELSADDAQQDLPLNSFGEGEDDE
jgi:hypothetical protein